jgi:hypothetical protein
MPDFIEQRQLKIIFNFATGLGGAGIRVVDHF